MEHRMTGENPVYLDKCFEVFKKKRSYLNLERDFN